MTGLTVWLLLCGAAGLLWPGTVSVPRSGKDRTAVRSEAEGRRVAAPASRATGPGPDQRGVRDPALMLDLAAAMLSAGRPLNVVLQVLSDAAEPSLNAVLRRIVTALELGASWEQAWELAGRHGMPSTGHTAAAASVLRDALAFAATSGAPSAQVLYAQAAQLRRRRAREAERRAAALGIHLVLPLGLCALPAFLCFTVVPLLLALLPEF